MMNECARSIRLSGACLGFTNMSGAIGGDARHAGGSQVRSQAGVAGGSGSVDTVELDGQVVEVLPDAMFRVQLDDGSDAACPISGKPRMNYVRILPGNRVRVQTGPS